MAAAIAFPPLGLAVNVATSTLDVPVAHALVVHLGMLGTPNVPAGTRDFPMQILQGLAFALARENPNNSTELDAVLYGVNGRK